MANSIGSSGNFLSGSQIVEANGTAVAIATGIWYEVTIFAKKANSGQVFVGGPDVASSTNSGLDAGEEKTLRARPGGTGLDLSDIYIDVGTNDDGIDFYATK
jgi:hypothetical protein